MKHATRPRRYALPRAVLSAGLGAMMLGACGDEAPLPVATLSIEVVPTERSVVFGEAFDLRLVLRRAASLQTETFDFRQLDPLVIEEVARHTRRDEQTVEEIIELKAHAFSLDRVKIEPLQWRAVGASIDERLVARSAPLDFEVRSALQPEDDLRPELPFAPRLPSRVSIWMLAVAGLSSIALVWFFIVRRRRVELAPTLPEVEPLIDPKVALLHELDGLRALASDAALDRAAAAHLAGAVARVLRAAIQIRVNLPAAVQTRAEIARDPRWNAEVPEREREALDRMLRQCERTQFARGGLTVHAANELLEDAHAFVIAEEAA